MLLLFASNQSRKDNNISENTSRGFYEDKGMVRRTLIMNQESLESLKKYSKKHKITQAELIDIVLAEANVERLDEQMAAKARQKSEESESLAKKIKNLSPDKLAAIKAIMEEE